MKTYNLSPFSTKQKEEVESRMLIINTMLPSYFFHRKHDEIRHIGRGKGTE